MEKQGEINENNKESEAPKTPQKPPTNENGRPLFRSDEEPRKKRVDTPKSNPGVAELFVWASSAFEDMNILSEGYLTSKSKSDIRQLTKDESKELENLKLYTFLNLEPMSSVSSASIHKALTSKNSKFFKEFSSIRKKTSSLQDYKNHVIAKYVEAVSR